MVKKSKDFIVGNVLYGQSGGPTSVINSSAYGLFKESFKHKNKINKVYAMHYGLEGLLDEDLIEIKEDDKNLSKLKNTPGAFYGSNRFKINYEKDLKILEKIYCVFKKYNIRYFFYNGGNDSMDSIYEIDKYLKSKNYECYSIGIPKTIDNDLVLTDHTPGFASAAKFIINTVTEIYYDDASYKQGRVNIVEIMGRNAGWLTASSMLAELNGAKPDLIYVPEVDFDINDFLNKVESIYSKKKHCLVCVSEGIHDKNGDLISKTNNQCDVFNHMQLGGVGIYLENLIKNKFNFKTRTIELSLLQRANSIIPSEFDIKDAINVGKYALLSALRKESNKMVISKRGANSRFTYGLANLEDIKNETKFLPIEYINKTHDYIEKSFIEYLLPLIQGKQKDHLNNDGLLDVYKLEK